MTFRRIISWGLIAGITYTEMQELPPGILLDEYVYRRQYDDQQHGIRRGEENWQATSA